MASFPKKLRTDETFPILIRLCDSFVRTPEKLICPIIKAEESVRVLFTLHEQTLKDTLYEAGEMLGLELISVTCCSITGQNHNMNGNIFIEYRSSELWDENTFKKYKDRLQSKLQDLNIQNALVDQVMEQATLPQPIITELDYHIHKLDSKIQTHVSRYSAEADTIPAELQSIRTLLNELKERRFSIALLSHNAIGKSFFLNLLLLLTAESNRQSGEDQKHRNIKLPEDITESCTVKMVKDEHYHELPEVIKDFLENDIYDQQNFKTLMQPICHELNATNEMMLRNKDTFSAALSSYCSDNKHLDMEPYLLPQKEDSGGFDATTKCVLHLRYGVNFQAQIEYFDEKELQNQLFELISLEKEPQEPIPDIVYEGLKERSQLSLKARFAILTENISANYEETLHSILKSITSPGNIRLSEQVMTFVGKTEMYVGNGINPEKDRLALRNLLMEYTSLIGKNTNMRQRVAALKRIVVYVPSKLLYGGKEIIEMPGTNESDPLAMSFIQDALDKADAVFLLSEFGFKLAGQEVKDMLRNSHFIKKWIKNSEEYKLMFLSYAEKDQTYQCGINDGDKVEEIKHEENKKRDKEFQVLETLIHPIPLSSVMKNNTVSSFVFPVLHTGIHAIQGIPHEILEKNKDILKNTGIDAIIKELDQFFVQKKKNIIDEIERTIADFEKNQMEKEKDGQESDADAISQNISFTQEAHFLKINNDLLNELKENHEHCIETTVNGPLRELMKRSAAEAINNWAEIESQITESGFFNPQYNGQHPLYKVKMYNKLFGHLDEEISQIFQNLLQNVQCALQDCKMAARIQQVLEDVQHSFLINTISLYNERWPANLAKVMVRFYIPLTSICDSQPGCTFCGCIRCSVCAYIESSTTFTSSSRKTEFKLKESFSCMSKSVIYLITCKKCRKQYVGQTCNTVRKRFMDHLSTINCKKDLSLSRHFTLPDHSVCDISLVVIEHVTDRETLMKREQYWILELDTLTPNGLNATIYCKISPK